MVKAPRRHRFHFNTKFLAALWLGLIFFLSPTPASAQCTIGAVHTGGGLVNFAGACPSGYQAYYFIDGNGATITSGVPTAPGGIVSDSATLADGSYTIQLRCADCDPGDPACLLPSYETCQNPTNPLIISAGPTPTPDPGTCHFVNDPLDCTIVDLCASGYGPQVTPNPPACGTCVCVLGAPTPTPVPFPTVRQPCDPTSGVCRTGLGDITGTAQGITTWAIRTVVGLAGGLSLLFLISGGLKWVTAGGDPKALMSARGIIAAALSGLLLVIFSVLILKTIGVDILKLPGLSAPGGGLEIPNP